MRTWWPRRRSALLHYSSTALGIDHWYEDEGGGIFVVCTDGSIMLSYASTEIMRHRAKNGLLTMRDMPKDEATRLANNRRL